MSTIRLIARRELRERIRTRAFRVGTAVLVALIVVMALVFSALDDDGPKKYDVGVVAGTPATVLDTATRNSDAFDAAVRRKGYPTESALRKAVLDKDVDAGLTKTKLLARDGAPDRLLGLLQASAQPAPPTVALERVGDPDDAGRGLATIGAVLLYLALLTFGYQLAASVVEEKSSRVVEIVLATVRPLQLLAGKVIGIGIAGLAQTTLIVVVGVVAAEATGKLDLPSATVPGAALIVLFFVLGYAFFAMAYAAAASLVSRQEDIQSVTMPITILLVAAYFLSFNAASDPNSTIATVAALVPFTAPMITPGIAIQGALSPLELIASILLMLAGIGLMLLFASRIYERAILLTGAPLKLSQAGRLLRRPSA